MGLDMYLIGTQYIGAQYEHNHVTGSVNLKKDGVKIVTPTDKIDQISLALGYWRKANAIHKWFVDHTQNGEDRNGSSEVSREQLEELLALTKDVLAHCKLVDGEVCKRKTMKNEKWEKIMEPGKIIEDSSYAQEHLPTTSGFFFGSTDYDEGYVRDLEDTVKILTEALTMKDIDFFKYSASW